MKRLFLATAALLLAAPLPALADTVAPAGQQQFDRLWLGSAWYPEQWPEERWAEDLRLMTAHGANVVRIVAFAGRRMEPPAGAYDMGWLVRACVFGAKYVGKVVVVTPPLTTP